MLIWLKSAGRWLQRVFSPSISAWTAAAYALLSLWGLLLVSFVFSDGLTVITWESMLGLTALFGLMALASVVLLFTAWLLGALITARPVFESVGFRVLAAQTVSVRGESMTNCRMEKPLPKIA